MIFLTSLRRRHLKATPAAFPLTLPLVRNLEQLSFPTPVTFLVGETGVARGAWCV